MRRICVLLALAWAASAAPPLPASLDGDCRRAIYTGLRVKVPSSDRAAIGLREAQRATERLSDAESGPEKLLAACEAEHEGHIESLIKELTREYKAAAALEKQLNRTRAGSGAEPTRLRRLFFQRVAAEVRAHKRLIGVERKLELCQRAAKRKGEEEGEKKGAQASTQAVQRLQRAERAAALAEGAAQCRREVEAALQWEKEDVGGHAMKGAVKPFRELCPDMSERFAPTDAQLSPAGGKAFCAGAVDAAQLMLEGGADPARATAQFCGNVQDPARFLRRLEAGPRALQGRFCEERKEEEKEKEEEAPVQSAQRKQKQRLVYGLDMHAPQFSTHRQRHAAPALSKCLRRCRNVDEPDTQDCLRGCLHAGVEGGEDQ